MSLVHHDFRLNPQPPWTGKIPVPGGCVDYKFEGLFWYDFQMSIVCHGFRLYSQPPGLTADKISVRWMCRLFYAVTLAIMIFTVQQSENSFFFLPISVCQ